MATTTAAKAAAATASGADSVTTAGGGLEAIAGPAGLAAISERLPPVRTHTV